MNSLAVPAPRSSNGIAVKMQESSTLQAQAANNTKAQFGSSPDLDAELVETIMGLAEAHSLMCEQALNSKTVQAGLKEILLSHAKLYESLRAKAEPPLST